MIVSWLVPLCGGCLPLLCLVVVYRYSSCHQALNNDDDNNNNTNNNNNNNYYYYSSCHQSLGQQQQQQQQQHTVTTAAAAATATATTTTTIPAVISSWVWKQLTRRSLSAWIFPSASSPSSTCPWRMLLLSRVKLHRAVTLPCTYNAHVRPILPCKYSN